MLKAWAVGAGIALDHDAEVPIGVQLDWALRAAVVHGRLRPGERLPGLREVAEQLGVNHNTVRSAVAKLEADGVLETRHGAGTFVAAGATARAAHATLVDETAFRAREVGIAPRELAAALYVADGGAGVADEAVVRRRALRQELAVLDGVLGDLEARLPQALPRTGAPSRGPRLLNAEELAAERDALVRRIVEVQRALDSEDEPPLPRPATVPRRASRRAAAPRPGTAPA